MANRQITVATLPQGKLRPDHFRLEPAPMPDPSPGKVLLRTYTPKGQIP